MIFAGSTFGLLAVLIDWAIIRQLFPQRTVQDTPKQNTVVDRAQLRPIVFREICPPPSSPGLSFYGGAPIGPATLVWPRAGNQPDGARLSFIMQWDATELARQDVTGLLPSDGALYLFADLNWGGPFPFQFIHASGPVHGWQALQLPADLPSIYGNEGAYAVRYCSPLIAKEVLDVPRLLPKWPFAPIAFAYPAPVIDPKVQAEEEGEGLYWSDGDRTAEALLALEYPQGAPAAKRLATEALKFVRPFSAFPHDFAAVRIVAAKVLDQLRRPVRLLPDATEDERQAQFEVWKLEAARRYELAAKHPAGAGVEQSVSDEMWQWMAGMEPVLRLGWRSLVEESVNVSLGLESEAIGLLPAELVARCSEQHRLAVAYLRDEYPDRSKPDELARWQARQAGGTLKEIRALHAPCPNHMFGPPSYVQGSVEEYLKDWVLLLELSTRSAIGHEFGEGVLQFLIRPFDLREGRLDQVKLIASAY
jgi:hypothetical protein